ncbi:MAG: hypothetical protein MUF38_01865 [Anaerolineae bacterium]|jgi:hypothetical protein|nr:hypothetical protein [Anaerolineae bacterium]
MGFLWGKIMLVGLLAVFLGGLSVIVAQVPTPTPGGVQQLTTDEIMATQQAAPLVDATPRMQPAPGRRPTLEGAEQPSSPLLPFLLVVLVAAAVVAAVIVYRRSI